MQSTENEQNDEQIADIDFLRIDPETRKSSINKFAYAKLHNSFNGGNNRRSVGSLRKKIENSESTSTTTQNRQETVIITTKTTEKTEDQPDSAIIPENSRHKHPTPKPRRSKKITSTIKDKNSNLLPKDDQVEFEERPIIVRHSTSEESIDRITKELDSFTMEKRAVEKKRVGGFRKFFSGPFFSKDKKKKSDDKTYPMTKQPDNDTICNETNINRQMYQLSLKENNLNSSKPRNSQEHHRHRTLSEEESKRMEKQYAEIHINQFNKIRGDFDESKADVGELDQAPPPKKSITDYLSPQTNTTSSSTSAESVRTKLARYPSDARRETPPRAQETNQNIKVVTPKSASKSSNLYQKEPESSSSNYKAYLNQPNRGVVVEDNYGTVFDSVDYRSRHNGVLRTANSMPPPSPKSPTFEGTKLRLPPNREIYSLQPRVKSPIPTDNVSTEKLIATELLKNSRSPTPAKKPIRRNEDTRQRPPISPRTVSLPKPAEQIVTDVLVHDSRSQKLNHPPPSLPQQEQQRFYSNVDRARSSTPVDLRIPLTLKVSPQKEDIRRSVEEYYWKELKKMKEKEDYDLYMMQIRSGYIDDRNLRRSRSVSPSAQRFNARSLSLPRGTYQYDYPDAVPRTNQPVILEDRTLVLRDPQRNNVIYEQGPQNFIRSHPVRRTVGSNPSESLQRPIFRRGSLNKQEIYETSPYNKKVSFPNSERVNLWPTRNGYTQSPPQRRLDKRDDILEDEVFLPEPIPNYFQQQQQQQPIYNNYDPRRRLQEPLYAQAPKQYDPRRLSIESLQRPEVYISHSQLVPKPVVQNQNRGVLMGRDDIYGRLSGARPVSSNNLNPYQRQSLCEPIYVPRQVTMRNKYCDIYGQIHDVNQTGVLMGQLSPGRASIAAPGASQNFVRGSRLTSSANDMNRRGLSNYVRSESVVSYNYDQRPLPPIPTKRDVKYPQISDTESSDASEIQRIMQNRPMPNNKKRGGLFGK